MDQKQFLRDVEEVLFTILSKRTDPTKQQKMVENALEFFRNEYPKVKVTDINPHYVDSLVACMDVEIGKNKRRFLTQNPNKKKGRSLTQYAKDARAGIRITWIIDRKTDEFTGRIHNGELVTSKADITKQSREETMAQYVDRLMKALPLIDRKDIESFIHRANNLGILK